MVSLTNFRSVDELTTLELEPDRSQLTNFCSEKSATGMSHHENKPINGKIKYNGFNQMATIDNKPSKSPAGAHEHFEIRWNNLTYEVEPKWYQQRWQALTGTNEKKKGGGKTRILNSLHGSVRSGQVTAILGPSGAGKTSLLGCLTGKNKSGVSGSVQILSNRQEPMSICTIPQKGKSDGFPSLSTTPKYIAAPSNLPSIRRLFAQSIDCT